MALQCLYASVANGAAAGALTMTDDNSGASAVFPIRAIKSMSVQNTSGATVRILTDTAETLRFLSGSVQTVTTPTKPFNLSSVSTTAIAANSGTGDVIINLELS